MLKAGDCALHEIRDVLYVLEHERDVIMRGEDGDTLFFTGA